MNKSLCFLIIPLLLVLPCVLSAQDNSDSIAATYINEVEATAIKGECVCYPKGHPNLGTLVGKDMTIDDCCKNQSKTQQCKLTNRANQREVWYCLDKKSTVGGF